MGSWIYLEVPCHVLHVFKKCKKGALVLSELSATQQTFTCSRSAIEILDETLTKGMEYD